MRRPLLQAALLFAPPVHADTAGINDGTYHVIDGATHSGDLLTSATPDVQLDGPPPTEL